VLLLNTTKSGTPFLHQGQLTEVAAAAAAEKGPVFINRPWDLKRYAARRGKKSVQLPPGATDVRIKLKRHEDWVFGTAFNPEWGKTRPADLEWYKDMTKQLFDSITPQYRFKWYRFEPNKGNYSFAYDIMETQYIAFARQAGFSMIRGHALQWRAGQPDWCVWCSAVVRSTAGVAHLALGRQC
jgi:GH35 family endo-1,4-beta-xylanase